MSGASNVPEGGADPPVPPGAGAPMPAMQLENRLAKLGALRDNGVLNEAEFNAAKAKILAQP